MVILMKTGILFAQGPFGKESYKVRIIRKFLGFYQIEAMRITHLSTRAKYLMAGDRCWVPGYAIRLSSADYKNSIE